MLTSSEHKLSARTNWFLFISDRPV